MTLGSHLLLLATSSDHFKIARHANNVLPAEVNFEAITSDPLRHQTCQHKDTPGPVEASADRFQLIGEIHEFRCPFGGDCICGGQISLVLMLSISCTSFKIQQLLPSR